MRVVNYESADKIIKTVRNFDTNKFPDGDLCRVQFYTSSNSWEVFFKFTDLLARNELSDKQFRFETTVERINIEKILLTNKLEYACSGPDECDKQFVYKSIFWFFGTYFEDFHGFVEPLILPYLPSLSKFLHK
jgi:hypothetical protein